MTTTNNQENSVRAILENIDIVLIITDLLSYFHLTVSKIVFQSNTSQSIIKICFDMSYEWS